MTRIPPHSNYVHILLFRHLLCIAAKPISHHRSETLFYDSIPQRKLPQLERCSFIAMVLLTVLGTNSPTNTSKRSGFNYGSKAVQTDFVSIHTSVWCPSHGFIKRVRNKRNSRPSTELFLRSLGARWIPRLRWACPKPWACRPYPRLGSLGSASGWKLQPAARMRFLW